ncbi:MAG: hypothetical protein JWN34_2152 [Bryobacterales bacterium]|nr:hypothetical protein [Bryobacterales bacterium]
MGVQLPVWGYVNPFIRRMKIEGGDAQRDQASLRRFIEKVYAFYGRDDALKIVEETDEYERPVLCDLIKERGTRGSIAVPDFRHLKEPRRSSPGNKAALKDILGKNIPVIVLNADIDASNFSASEIAGDGLEDAIIRETLLTREEIGDVVWGWRIRTIPKRPGRAAV